MDQGQTTFERRTETNPPGPTYHKTVQKEVQSSTGRQVDSSSYSQTSSFVPGAKVDQLKSQATAAMQSVQAKLQPTVQSIQTQVQSMHLPQSASDVWESLPSLWRWALFSDAFILWPVLGSFLLFAPLKALSAHRSVANIFGWAGPTPAVASNALVMNVQALGSFLLSLSILAGYGWYRRDVYFARIYSAFRLVLAGCLLYACYGAPSHPSTTITKGNSTYNILIPFALHSLFHAGCILSSGPEIWGRMFSRLPSSFSSGFHQHAA